MRCAIFSLIGAMISPIKNVTSANTKPILNSIFAMVCSEMPLVRITINSELEAMAPNV